MRRTRARSLGILLVVGALLTTAGCGHREPDPNEVILYIKNARVGGKVRRQWPEGQQYLDAVMRADAGYRRAVSALLDLRTPAALWAADDGRWRDGAAVDEARAGLRGLASDAAATARADAFATLRAAVEQPPGGVGVEDVWAALAWEGQDLREVDRSLPVLLELAARHEALLGQADALAQGQEAAVAAHAALQQVIDDHQQAYAAMVRAGFDDAEGRLQALGEDKALLKAGPDDEQRWQRLRALEDRIDYQMARRKHFEDLGKALRKSEPATG